MHVVTVASRALPVAVLVSLLAVLPASAVAIASRASFTDIEDEVMCVVCGVPLNIAEAPQADRERAYIRRLIKRGKTKSQIKQALVEQLGPRVLGLPSASGFSLAAYLVPLIGTVVAIAAIFAAAGHWRRNADQHEPRGPQPITVADRKRLEADLRDFDR